MAVLLVKCTRDPNDHIKKPRLTSVSWFKISFPVLAGLEANNYNSKLGYEKVTRLFTSSDRGKDRAA